MVELEARRVSRTYGDCIAVADASVRLVPGKIHAIVGENGAGKSTLLKMLAGAIAPSTGEIWVGGRPLVPATPREAIHRGVGLVYQHFSLIAAFTGLENLMLGAEPTTAAGLLDPRRTALAAAEIGRRTGLDVPLERPVAELGVGEQQRLEILRLLVRGAKALLLDEPTAVLTRGEATALYDRLRAIADEGATVAVVTHHLDEVCRHADEVTVMRAGRVVHHGDARSETPEALAQRALGDVPTVPPPPAIAAGAPVVLELRGVSASTGASRCEGVSLSIRAGEVVGIAGVDGNGQDALVQALAGLAGGERGGAVRVGEVDVTREDVRGRRARGLEVVHGDRLRYGLIPGASVRDNLVLGDAGGPDEDVRAARRLLASRAVPADESRAASSFSGGNQQKLVLARALDRAPCVLIASHPTRGIDAAAAADVRARLLSAARAGAALLVVSSDLGELRAVSHRLLVMHRGRVVAELPPDADEATLGQAMLGGEA